jgi:hypothetical protein
MSTMLAVPARLVQSLREGVRLEIFGLASEEITELTYSERPVEDYREPLARFKASYRLLNDIGWVRPVVQHDVWIDLDQYGALVLQALACQLATEREQAQYAPRASERNAAAVLVDILGGFLAVLQAGIGATEAAAGPQPAQIDSQIQMEPTRDRIEPLDLPPR